jgi:hypothetical protein
VKQGQPRLIRIEYSGAADLKVGRAVTIEGAIRASVLRVAQKQYANALIFDNRFMEQKEYNIRIHKTPSGVSIYFRNQPRWSK